ncbi:MAG: type IX secretion system membrane protein PorP/SprF [Flavobacteriales bacterium]|nr:type IX secretion system membrane protein PorP/SprF [Flavobacteriales bacterium]NNK80137.1 type IX secretion system membrane protein PorP/SprF [Flavobacteriales bacterium]
MKRLITISIVAFLSASLWSQQELLVSQYMFNGLFINPAYSGSHEYWEATALHRSQWVNFDGAPVTQMIEVDGPLANRKLGLGAIVIHDDIGDTEQFEFSANGSYHLDLDSERKNRLSFGLRIGFTNYSFRFDDTKVFEDGDQVFQDQISNEFVPKVGAGVYYYTDKMYAGVSVPTLFAGDNALSFQVDSNSTGGDETYFENHLFINGGYVIDASENLKVKPNILIKYHPSAPLQVDINANFLVYEKVWIGASYRTSADLVGIVEFNVTPQIRIGYSYDFTFNDIGNYSNGSHEVMLGYNFGKEIIKMKSPRYF